MPLCTTPCGPMNADLVNPFLMFAAGSGLSAATVSDLHELRALLMEAKAENDQLRAERDEVGRLQQTIATGMPAYAQGSNACHEYGTQNQWAWQVHPQRTLQKLHHRMLSSTTGAMAVFRTMSCPYGGLLCCPRPSRRLRQLRQRCPSSTIVSCI